MLDIPVYEKIDVCVEQLVCWLTTVDVSDIAVMEELIKTENAALAMGLVRKVRNIYGMKFVTDPSVPEDLFVDRSLRVTTKHKLNCEIAPPRFSSYTHKFQL